MQHGTAGRSVKDGRRAPGTSLLKLLWICAVGPDRMPDLADRLGGGGNVCNLFSKTECATTSKKPAMPLIKCPLL